MTETILLSASLFVFMATVVFWLHYKKSLNQEASRHHLRIERLAVAKALLQRAERIHEAMKKMDSNNPRYSHFNTEFYTLLKQVDSIHNEK